MCFFAKKSEFFLVKSCFYFVFFLDKSEWEDCIFLSVNSNKINKYILNIDPDPKNVFSLYHSV